MDPAVAVVQAYLQLNGYLTVTEFPIAGVRRTDGALTDIDVIGLRFPHARPLGSRTSEAPDPALGVPEDAVDLLIGEVKEGKARMNRNLRREDTLVATLERVGCCPVEHVPHHARQLIQHGVADMTYQGARCRARLTVFAGRPGDHAGSVLIIPLSHAVAFVLAFLDRHQTVLHGVRLTQPALGYLALLRKLQAHSSQAFTASGGTEP